MPRAASAAVLAGAGPARLRHYRATTAARVTVTAQDAHVQLMSSFRNARSISGQLRPTRFLPGEITSLGQVSEPSVADSDDKIRVVLRPSPSLGRMYDQVSRAPASDEPMARAVTSSQKQPDHPADSRYRPRCDSRGRSTRGSSATWAT